jgi:hypothetical protein
MGNRFHNQNTALDACYLGQREKGGKRGKKGAHLNLTKRPYEALAVGKSSGWTTSNRSGLIEISGRGDKKALKSLISYNNADIINLGPLMELAY